MYIASFLLLLFLFLPVVLSIHIERNSIIDTTYYNMLILSSYLLISHLYDCTVRVWSRLYNCVFTTLYYFHVCCFFFLCVGVAVAVVLVLVFVLVVVVVVVVLVVVGVVVVAVAVVVAVFVVSIFRWCLLFFCVFFLLLSSDFSCCTSCRCGGTPKHIAAAALILTASCQHRKWKFMNKVMDSAAKAYVYIYVYIKLYYIYGQIWPI